MYLQAALIAVTALVPQPAAGSAAIELNAYLGELDRVSATVRSAPTFEQAGDIALLLPDRWVVNIDGEVTTVDATWIRTELAAADAPSWPSVRDRVARRLDGMRLEAAEPRLQHLRDPRAALTETLGRKEFQRAPPSMWLERQRERVGRWLLGLISRLFGASMGTRAVAELFAWIVSVLALAAVSIWLVSMLTRRSRAMSLDLDSSTLKPAPAREWALLALAAARDGHLREAVRCGYHAALRRFEEQGAWNIDDSRTAREYVQILPRDDPRYGMLRDLTHRFEQVWYGRRTATGDDAREMAAQLERLGCLRPGERTI